MTLASSAARNDLDISVYFADILNRLLTGDTDFHPMRADIWKRAHPEAVRNYRRDEHRNRAEVKRVRRARRRHAAASSKPL